MTTTRDLPHSAGSRLPAAQSIVGPSANGKEGEGKEPLVYELRTYTTAPGRLPDLHARFRDHTVRIFEKHSIKSVAYWTPTVREDTLVYIVAHKSQAAAQISWQTFLNDPESRRVFQESRQHGPIVIRADSQFLVPTEYSPLR